MLNGVTEEAHQPSFRKELMNFPVPTTPSVWDIWLRERIYNEGAYCEALREKRRIIIEKYYNGERHLFQVPKSVPEKKS